MLKITYILLAFVLITVLGGCTTSTSMKAESNNQDSVKSHLDQEPSRLPKDLFILIGRGNCCSGHIISISRNGDIEYSVGTYSRPKSNVKVDMPEIYDPNLVKLDKTYAQKHMKISANKLEQLASLIRNEENLHFQDKSVVTDDFLYNIYLDKKKIATGL